MKKIVIIMLLLISMLSLVGLKLLTEQYPPYNFEQNGQLKGISIDIMDEMLKKVNIGLSRNDIELWNWTRAYQTTEKAKDHALFAMTYTDERAPLFKWVGPFSPTKQVLMAKKSKGIKINSPNDINKYKVGVIRDDVGHQLLKKIGVQDSSYDFADNSKTNAKKLAGGRVDLVAYEGAVMSWEMKEAGININDYEEVYTLKEGQLYFAFNKDTSDTTIKKFQKALDELKKEGKVESIIKKYLK